MRLKLDENLGRRWAEQLRQSGHDVHTVVDEQLSGTPDVDVLAAAVREGRAVVSLDLDFANPVRFPPAATSGIIVLRVRDLPGREDLEHAVSRLARALATAEVTGRLWIVDRDRVRQYEAPSD